MAIREYLNNNPAVVTIAAIVLLIVCLALIVRQLLGGGGPGSPRDVYFYDTATGQVFTESAAQFAPIEAPSGPGAGVRAHIYACGDCEDIASDIDDGMTIADIAALGAQLLYVERVPPDLLARSQAGAGSPEEEMALQEELSMKIEYAAIVDGSVQAWQPSDNMSATIDPEAGWQAQLSEMLEKLCPGGERPAVCLPPR